MMMMLENPERWAARQECATRSFRLELSSDVAAPAVARAAMIGQRESFGLSTSDFPTLVLLVSEVVSNAVLHAHPPPGSTLTLMTTVARDVVRISVTDAGRGFTPRPPDPARTTGGYGLYLLERAASRWGVERTAHGSRVWFELPRESAG